ncbi:hypothetical protein Dimus_004971 [Dionaea muscipula]
MITFRFAVRLLALAFSRIVGASVRFRLGGWNCLRDVVVQFRKGAVESVSVGEVRLSIREFLVNLGVGFLSRDPKLQLLICGLEVVMRPSSKGSKRTSSRKPRRSGKGKSMAIANVARFLSVSVTDLVFKTPKATLEVKKLRVDISTEGRTKPSLSVRLVLSPIAAHLEPRLSHDQSSFISSEGCNPPSQSSVAEAEKPLAVFTCEELALSCKFGHDRFLASVEKTLIFSILLIPVTPLLLSSILTCLCRDICGICMKLSWHKLFMDLLAVRGRGALIGQGLLKIQKIVPPEAGMVVNDVDLACGEVAINLNEEVFQKTKKSNNKSDDVKDSSVDCGDEKISSKKQGFSVLTKSSAIFPEKVSFNLPKLDVKFVHQGQNLVVENHIKGIQLRSTKSIYIEDMRETTRLDLQLDLSEIHLLRDAGSSILEILKVTIVSSVYVPPEPSRATRVEIDVKLGGTGCHVMLSRLVPWMRLHFSKEKKMVLKEETPVQERPKATESKAIMWTCTVSAPEMTVVLYSITGMPLFQGCSQSSHVFANNISNTGTSLHAEFGEFNLHLADEYSECVNDSLFSMEASSGSLILVAKVSLDFGKKEGDTLKEDGSRSRQVLSVDVSGMGVYLTMRRVESLIVTAILLQTLFKRLSGTGKRSQGRAGHSSKSSGKGAQLLKLNLERCSINYQGDVGLENTVVEDPKRVYYGSQGGRVLITVSDDGTTRTAYVMSTVSDDCKKLKYSVSLEIFHLILCVNKEKQSTQVELERARSIYQEHPDQLGTSTEVLLLDIQNAKFVRRSGGLKEVALCSLFSATDIAVRWEPDVHISLFELMLYLKLLVHTEKLKGLDADHLEGSVSMPDSSQMKEAGTATNLQKNRNLFSPLMWKCFVSLLRQEMVLKRWFKCNPYFLRMPA